MDEFRDTIERLWSALGLPTPAAIDDDGKATLTVDDAALDLVEAPDGRGLIVSAVAGPLADEASARDREIREILQANLAHLLACRAGTRVERQDNRRLLVVEAAYSYATRDISALGALIQDVA